ncbi:RagB/SusD family nutrient uptake outer membrane protein [Pedobacter sp. SYP-B3415]|uniref:RagB/SusD family nutrient uptake outer membrane protein n=1 Tax=Pedobacter sp. SYP-B3415 TaxID=2496641 RepID=UPI00101DA270|nr:RagB/SusD family nutrient uptake outer membrane protein [Pedobacter sp. SYP-B3415]
MKFRYIVYTGMLMSTLVASSCKKSFFDEPPVTSIDARDALNTEADVLTALNGSYAGLRSSTLYGRAIPLLGDLMADNVLVSTRNSGRYTAQNNYNYVINNADVLGIWQNAYAVILRVNNIIASTPTGNAVNINQYKGEAYALRALCYFELVKFFARPYTDNPGGPGVPLVLKFDINAKPPRATVQQVYDQILSDLNQAFTLMTLTPAASRIGKYTALGLSAKVNLYKGTAESNQLAFDQARTVITSSGKALLTAGNFSNYWTAVTPQTYETLFEVQSDQIDNAGFDELPYFYSQSGYGDGLATKGLYDLYSATDLRKGLITVGSRARAENPAYIINKISNTQSYGGKKVLRISEMYLIAAEAAYNLSRPADAVTNLTTLLAQRDPAATVTETGAALFERIITERRKELAFEGDRYPTLNRLKRDITGRSGSVPTVAYTNYRRVFPIPQAEQDRNPMTQNQGW